MTEPVTARSRALLYLLRQSRLDGDKGPAFVNIDLIEDELPRIEREAAAQAEARVRTALELLDAVDGIVDDTHPEGDGCPLCRTLDDLRAALAAPPAADVAAVGREAVVTSLSVYLHRKGVGCEAHRGDEPAVADVTHRDDAYGIYDHFDNLIPPPAADVAAGEAMTAWPEAVSDGLTLPCSDCGQVPRFDYRVGDEFWRRWVPGSERLGVLCLPCLDRRCNGVGLADALVEVQWTGTAHTVALHPTRRHKYALRAAGSLAERLGANEYRFPAEWRVHGRRAGHVRNAEMLDTMRPDLVLAFPLVGSRGTWDMVRQARERSVPVEIIE